MPPGFEDDPKPPPSTPIIKVPGPPPPVPPQGGKGQFCQKVYERCVQGCQNVCGSGYIGTSCRGACFAGYLVCVSVSGKGGDD
jgi:hypothetical protein